MTSHFLVQSLAGSCFLLLLVPSSSFLCYAHWVMSRAAKDANNTKRYISHALQQLPGEKYVSVSYKDILSDEDIAKGVKRGVKYLAEVVSNKKSMEVGVDGLELPVKKSRACLSSWMYCVMNSKCYNDGSQDCDPTLWKICGL